MRGRKRNDTSKDAARVLQINAERTVDFLYVVNRSHQQTTSDNELEPDMVVIDDDDDESSSNNNINNNHARRDSESHLDMSFADNDDDAGADLEQAPESLRVRVSAVQFTMAFGFLAEIGIYQCVCCGVDSHTRCR
jgi:hypothetical protein